MKTDGHKDSFFWALTRYFTEMSLKFDNKPN